MRATSSHGRGWVERFGGFPYYPVQRFFGQYLSYLSLIFLLDFH